MARPLSAGSCLLRNLVRILSLGAVLFSLGAAPAFAYVVTRVSPTVVRVERDLSEDGTATGNVVVWTSPKSVAYPSYQYTSSFNVNLTHTSLLGAQVRSVEVTIPADSLCLVEVGAGTTQKNLFQPVAAGRVAGEVTVTAGPAFPDSMDVTVTAMPDVSLTSSVSVDGTLPVTVQSVGGFDSKGLTAAGVVLLLGGGIALMGVLETRGHD